MEQYTQAPQSQNTFTNQTIRNVDPSTIQYRLDTQRLLKQIEIFLRGKLTTIEEDKNGDYVEVTKVLGTPKANDVGIQTIMNRCTVLINPSTVQGNFITDNNGYSKEYEEYICFCEKSMAKDLFLNMYKYEIAEEDYQGIIDFIMSLVIPFMSRLIGDKERESYGVSMRATDTMNNNERPSAFAFWRRGGR